MALAVAVVTASCATGPRTRPPEGEGSGEFAALAPGALAYISVDVGKARPILDLLSLGGFSGRQAEELLDKTGSAVAAAYPPGFPRSFLVAARGAYPGFRAALSFALSPSWKRTRSPEGGFYWRSSRQGLSVALDKGRAFVSDGDPLVPPPGPEVPEPYGALRREALLAGWSDYGGTSLNQFLAYLGLPLQLPADRIVFAVYDSPAGGKPGAGWEPEDGFVAVLRVETPSESHARGLAAIFSLARRFLGNLPPEAGEGSLALAAALFANIPVQDGAALIVRTGPLDAPEIALLFRMLSLYSF